VGEFEGEVGVREGGMGACADMGTCKRHMVTRRDPGIMPGMETCLFSSLLNSLLVVGSGLVISPYRCGLNPSGLLLSVS
jgi:hypothetical protein